MENDPDYQKLIALLIDIHKEKIPIQLGFKIVTKFFEIVVSGAELHLDINNETKFKAWIIKILENHETLKETVPNF